MNTDTNTQRPCFDIGDKDALKNDALKFPDDATLTTKGPEAIYAKLIAFDEATKDYRLPINWNKVTILVKNTIKT